MFAKLIMSSEYDKKVFILIPSDGAYTCHTCWKTDFYRIKTTTHNICRKCYFEMKEIKNGPSRHDATNMNVPTLQLRKPSKL